MRVDTSALSTGQPPPDLDAERLRAIWLAKADNIRRAWAHFEAKDLVVSSMPYRVSLELTQNCNFKCIMCAQAWEEHFQKWNPDYNMSLPLFMKLADQLFPLAVNVDLRGFGETTILPYWPEIVDSLDRYPYIEWNLVSNLSLMRDETWRKMMKSNFVIGFSCDGATARTYETIRVGGDFARACHNVQVIQDAIKTHKSGYLYFISVIQRMNAHEMRPIIELAHSLGIDEVQFHIVRGPRSLRIETDVFMLDDKLPRYANEAIDAALDLGVTATFNTPIFTRRADPDKVQRVSTRAPMVLPETSFHGAPWKAEMAEYETKLVDAYRIAVHQRCFKPFSYGNVNYRGHMGTCNHMQHPGIKFMGDLNSETVASVWNGDKYQEFRKELLTATPTDPRCQWCFGNRLAD
jgi:hypothetical protein